MSEWMFERDARRFFRAAEATTDMPAGSGALAGLNWDLDRDALAEPTVGVFAQCAARLDVRVDQHAPADPFAPHPGADRMHHA